MIIDLSGPWLMREALGETWRWYVDSPLDTAPDPVADAPTAGDNPTAGDAPTAGDTPTAGNNVGAAAAVAARTPGWLPARVPGSVRGDLLRAGEIPSPYVGRDSKASEWVSERHWVYRCVVALPRPLDAGELCVLELDGVDPAARVLVDGVPVGRAHGPFGVTRLDVTAALADGGEHRLALVLEPAPASEPQVGRTERVRIHAPRMTYGWDFCPRLVHQGIWRSARLVVGVVVDDGLWATTRLAGPPDDASAGGTSGSAGEDVGGVEFTESAAEAAGGTSAVIGVVRVRGSLRTTSGRRLRVEAWAAPAPGTAHGRPAAADHAIGHAIRPDCVTDGVVGGQEITADERGVAVVDLEIRVPDPALWWPHGAGPQHRYDVELLADDELVWGRRVAFRSAVWHANPGAPAGAEPYSLAVNGREVRLTGWNWAPADALYGEITPARLRHLMTVARDSGARLLRVWGGGLIETPEFYDTADELGLLVWQEFSMSSSGMQSAPATDPEFVELMRAAARDAVAAIGHHPSLVLWGGGNELDSGGVPLSDDRSPVLAAIGAILAELDPDRRWVSTSPTGPVFHNRLDVIAERPGDLHDVHGPWEHQGLAAQHLLYNAGTCLAHTEFGVEGMANARTLAALVPGDPRPLDRSNPVMRHLGEWWNNAALVHESFGGALVGAGADDGVGGPGGTGEAGGREDLDAVRRASQLLQATGLAYAVEADLRRSPRCSMVLPWQLAESFPNAWCTAVVDHRGDAKPALHAVARAFAPERVTIRTDREAWAPDEGLAAEAWVWSEPGRAAGGSVELRLLGIDGHVVVDGSAEGGLAADDGDRAAGPLPGVGHPRRAAILHARPQPPGVYLWEATWRDADGTIVDVERQLTAVGKDWSALADLPPADVTVDVAIGVDASGADLPDRAGPDPDRPDPDRPDPDRWTVRVANRSAHALPLVHLLDGRPIDAPGWARVTGAGGPLLPGHTREFAVTWDDAPLTTPAGPVPPHAGRPHGGPVSPHAGRPHGGPVSPHVGPVPRVLVLDVWNTPPMTITDPRTGGPS